MKRIRNLPFKNKTGIRTKNKKIARRRGGRTK
jgi:hypothetical protein